MRLFRGKISARPVIALRARKPTLIIADQNFKKSTESNISNFLDFPDYHMNSVFLTQIYNWRNAHTNSKDSCAWNPKNWNDPKLVNTVIILNLTAFCFE